MADAKSSICTEVVTTLLCTRKMQSVWTCFSSDYFIGWWCFLWVIMFMVSSEPFYQLACKIQTLCTSSFHQKISDDTLPTSQGITCLRQFIITGVKCKAVPICHAGAKGEKYSSYSFLTSALDQGEWSASWPGRALTPGKGPRYPLYRRLWPTHLIGVSGQHHGLAMHEPQGKDPSSHCTGGWAGLRTGLGTEVRGKILCFCWGSNLGHPICSQTLHWGTSAPLLMDTNCYWSVKYLEKVQDTGPR
jgi:hypothetical protein